MNIPRTLALAAASAFVCASPAVGQAPRVHDVPPRPVLWAQADTNSAASYFSHGSALLDKKPAEAAAAFYWAARLQPGWADALYGRRVALLMSDPERLVRYMQGHRATARLPEVQAIDSLQLRALALDPFFIERFDRQFLRFYLIRAVMENMRRGSGESSEELASHLVREYLQTSDGSTRAWVMYSEGRFGEAVTQYESAIRNAPGRDRPFLQTQLARVSFFAGNLPKAAEHFTAAAQGRRESDTRDLVRVYESKAILEHSLGAVYEEMGNATAAQEAYGRALQEDLSFGPAHRRLSAMAMARGDSATAVSELALAVELSPAEPGLRYEYGMLLVHTRKTADAFTQFEKAAELEPFYAAPRLMIARIYDASDVHDLALVNYRAYLERASKTDEGLAVAQARVAVLQAEADAAR